MAGRWIQKATSRMKRRGTLGSFGSATAKKIAAGKAKGGLAAKRAVFAENVKRIAQRRARRSPSRTASRTRSR